MARPAPADKVTPMQTSTVPMSRVLTGWTLAQEQAQLAVELERNEREMARHQAEIGARMLEYFHANCNLCGRFTPKERWLAKA